MSLTWRGINYDTGTNYRAGGQLSRRVWRPEVVREEIHTIREALHCNAVGVYGSDLTRLVEAATVALEAGLHVWLQPRLIDAGPADTLANLAAAAEAAETLRRRYGPVTLNVGCELTVFATGIIPGAGYQERSARLASPLTWPRLPWYNRRLNRLLGRAADVARSRFHGPLTYGAGLWERVDWTRFDVVGLDYYRVPFNRRRYQANLRRFHRHGKPVVVVEFGSAAFDGAVAKGPAAHEIIDWDGPTPHIPAGHRRDEDVQAAQIAELLGIYRASGVHGAFVFEFIEPEHPHSPDPRHDLDMAGYGVVKVLPGADPDSYRWEPKAAFHTVARLYSGAAAGVGSQGHPPHGPGTQR